PATSAVNRGRFEFEISRSQTLPEGVARRRRKRCVWKRAQQSHKQPMSVHRRMPVVTPIKRRRELVRRRDVCVAVQDMTDLVRVFLPNTRERELGEPLRCLCVERRCFYGGTCVA